MACNCENDKTGASSVPYIVYESEQARNERHIKRFISALIVTVALLFLSNAAWLYAWCQYDYSSEETAVDVNADDGGNANYIGNDGDIINGKNNSNEENS